MGMLRGGGPLLSTLRAVFSQQEGKNILAPSMGSGLQPGCRIPPSSVAHEVKTLFSEIRPPNDNFLFPLLCPLPSPLPSPPPCQAR